jgi:hypothetical protein
MLLLLFRMAWLSLGSLGIMSTPHFPDDENGNVLKRMFDGGDDLSRPRIVDFCFAFPGRQQALAFAEIVDDRDLEVCISSYDEREMWQAIVKRRMIPTHRDITALESRLTSQAESVGGEADGWGCMRLTKGVADA